MAFAYARLFACFLDLQLSTCPSLNVPNFIDHHTLEWPARTAIMSNTTAKDSRTTGSAITPNNVQQRNKPAEYFFHSMWMRAQDLDAKLQKYKEMPMAKALEMSTYRASIYKAQAKAYREAANATSEEMRSGWVRRAMVLGCLAG